MGLKCRIVGHKFPVKVTIPAEDNAPKIGKYEFPRECVRCGAKAVLHVNVTKEGTTVVAAFLEERLNLKITLSDENDTQIPEKAEG